MRLAGLLGHRAARAGEPTWRSCTDVRRVGGGTTDRERREIDQYLRNNLIDVKPAMYQVARSLLKHNDVKCCCGA